MVVCVLSKNGKRLMPTTRIGKVRHLIEDGKAVIVKRKPFTIQLTYESKNYVQPIELCVDTGYQHIGVNVKSESKEYVANQYDLLSNEKERHDDCRRYRRNRRNRLRYRKPRFSNRAVPKGWLAPSLLNKANCHIQLVKNFCAAMPITKIILEVGSFDTQVLQAIQEGKPIPQGLDYQHGPQYGIDTLREAVFQRDSYKCIFCGRSAVKDGAVLHVHHAYFWRGQHGNRLEELASVCEKCHTPANHKEGGLLWGYDKKLPRYTGAAFMNAVRWYIYDQVKAVFPDVKITYGAITKRKRLSLKLEKTHINDAFAMGDFHPAKRAEEQHFQKRRRNNRILSKFYDAKYIDSRDGSKKSGQQLFNGRINRNHKRDSENLHKYRKRKISAGRRNIRQRRYSLRPGDTVMYEGTACTVKGVQNKGQYVGLQSGKVVAITKIQCLWHCGGWQIVQNRP